MGNIREWSNILDLLYSAEFFSAVIYGDEAEWYEEDGEHNGKDWAKTRKSAREEDRAGEGVNNQRYSYVRTDTLYERIAGLVERENYTAYEECVIYEPFWRDNIRTEFVERKIMHGDDGEGFENKESIFKDDGVMSVSEEYRNEDMNPIDSIKIAGKSKRDRILNVGGYDYVQRSGNVKIEVTNNNTIEKESDIESISDMLTERLYEMMVRGSDGLY